MFKHNMQNAIIKSDVHHIVINEWNAYSLPFRRSKKKL